MWVSSSPGEEVRRDSIVWTTSDLNCPDTYCSSSSCVVHLSIAGCGWFVHSGVSLSLDEPGWTIVVVICPPACCCCLLPRAGETVKRETWNVKRETWCWPLVAADGPRWPNQPSLLPVAGDLIADRDCGSWSCPSTWHVTRCPRCQRAVQHDIMWCWQTCTYHFHLCAAWKCYSVVMLYCVMYKNDLYNVFVRVIRFSREKQWQNYRDEYLIYSHSCSGIPSPWSNPQEDVLYSQKTYRRYDDMPFKIQKSQAKNVKESHGPGFNIA